MRSTTTRLAAATAGDAQDWRILTIPFGRSRLLVRWRKKDNQAMTNDRGRYGFRQTGFRALCPMAP